MPVSRAPFLQGTLFDFTVPHSVGEKLRETYENTVLDAYDHNFVLDNKKKVDTTVYDPVSGRIMEVMSDQPGIQFFSGSGCCRKNRQEQETIRSIQDQDLLSKHNIFRTVRIIRIFLRQFSIRERNSDPVASTGFR